MRPFSYIYYILSLFAYFLALPLLIFLVFKKRYKNSILARFFLFHNKKFTKSDGIWFHACSFGEIKALKPLLQRLDDEDIKITAMTNTGYEAAKEYQAEVRYLPFEIFLPFWIKPQKILIILEAEFWYMLFAIFYARGGKIILLNARISEKSVKKYMKMRWFYKKLLFFVDKVYCQSEIDAYRFETLGAKNIEIIGNIKFAQKIVITKKYQKPQITTIVAASTHENEEKLILASYKKYLKNTQAKLIVAPRHPERFDLVFELLKQFADDNALQVSRLSKDTSLKTDIILVDMMGELNNIYNISDIAILGGSFFKTVGGHNPLEPAYFGCKIITGIYFTNQKELFKYTQHVQYVNGDEIYKALKKSEQLPNSSVSQTIDLDSVVKYIKKK